jgi:hypothetical protein
MSSLPAQPSYSGDRSEGCGRMFGAADDRFSTLCRQRDLARRPDEFRNPLQRVRTRRRHERQFACRDRTGSKFQS